MVKSHVRKKPEVSMLLFVLVCFFFKSSRLQVNTLDLNTAFPVPVNRPSIQQVVCFLVRMLPCLVPDWTWLSGHQLIEPLFRVECRFSQELTVLMLSTIGILFHHLICWQIITNAVEGLHCCSDKCSHPEEVYYRCSGCDVGTDLDHWDSKGGELGLSDCPLWPWASSSRAVLMQHCTFPRVPFVKANFLNFYLLRISICVLKLLLNMQIHFQAKFQRNWNVCHSLSFSCLYEGVIALNGNHAK